MWTTCASLDYPNLPVVTKSINTNCRQSTPIGRATYNKLLQEVASTDFLNELLKVRLSSQNVFQEFIYRSRSAALLRSRAS